VWISRHNKVAKETTYKSQLAKRGWNMCLFVASRYRPHEKERLIVEMVWPATITTIVWASSSDLIRRELPKEFPIHYLIRLPIHVTVRGECWKQVHSWLIRGYVLMILPQVHLRNGE
jgi:hypothetical protein